MPDALYPLLLLRGKPEYIRSDNGSEFIATAPHDWLRKVGIKPIQIYPGLHWENGYNERFNATLRREVLTAEWFHTTKQAQIIINTPNISALRIFVVKNKVYAICLAAAPIVSVKILA